MARTNQQLRRPEAALAIAGAQVAPVSALPALLGLARGRLSASERVMILQTLLRRDDGSASSFVGLAEGLDADDELVLATTAAVLPPELFALLARSRRKKTLRALLKRDDLPTDTAEAIYKRVRSHADKELVHLVLGHDAATAGMRVDAVERGLRGSWSHRDPALRERRLIAELLARLFTIISGREPKPLLRVLSGDIPEWAFPVLQAELAGATEQAVASWCGATNHNTSAFAAGLGAIAKRPDAADLVESIESGSVGTDWLLSQGSKREGVSGAGVGYWKHPRSATALYHCGLGRFRQLALASEGLDHQLRSAAVAHAVGDDLLAVAINPELSSDEVAVLLERLPEGERWRLWHARLDAGQQAQVVSTPGVGWLLAQSIDRCASTSRQAWTTFEVGAALLSDRDRLLPSGSFAEVAQYLVSHIPELAPVAVAHLRADDRLSDTMARQIIELMLTPSEAGGPLDAGAVSEVVCSMFADWEGGMAELAATGVQLATA